MAALWPDTFVEEANLSFQISVLRRALATEAAQLLETVPKHGYRFTADVLTAPTSDVSRAERPSGGRRSSGTLVAAKPTHVVLVAASVVGLAVAGYLVTSSNSRPTTPVASGPLATPLTAYPGFEQAPTLSPDGSQVAFSWNGAEQDNFDIYVKLVGPGEPWRLTKSPAHDDKPAWAPDGARIAFLRFISVNASGKAADLMVIPALGGAERKIATVGVRCSLGLPVCRLPLAGLRRYE